MFSLSLSQDLHPADLLKDREVLSKIDHQLTLPEKEKLGESGIGMMSITLVVHF